jgi:tetratricopeptide (TPR) repeat protein
VVGKVFWRGSLGPNGGDIEAELHALERKGFVRRQRRSSVADEPELAFAHALVRDVAYGQIPRPERSLKHRRVAEWIESLGRPEDHAEMVAHHWRSALDLAEAAGQEVSDLRGRTRTALREAGDRAFALNAFAQSSAYYLEALERTPASSPERPDLLFRHARALHVAEDTSREAALEEARGALLGAGDRERAAEVEAFLADVAWFQGNQAATFRHLEEAKELLESERSPAEARVLAISSRRRVISGDLEGELEAREALELAEELGLDELRAHALGTIGVALSRRGDAEGGIAATSKALEMALQAASPHAAVLANNLASQVMTAGDYRRGAELWEEAWKIGSRFGQVDDRFAQGVRAWILLDTGRWDEALELADAFIAESEAGFPHYQLAGMHGARGTIRLARGDLEGAREDFRRAEAFAREAGDPQILLPVLTSVAAGYLDLGLLDEARRAAREMVPVARDHLSEATALAYLAPMAADVGIEEDVRAIAAAMPDSRWRQLIVLGLDRRLSEAIVLLDAEGLTASAAYTRLQLAEAVIGTSRRTEGERELAKALAFFRSVSATFYIERGEALLAKTA